LNDVFTLIESQKERHRTRSAIKNEALYKTSAVPALLQDCQRTLKTAVRLRRKCRISGPDPLQDLYRHLEDARKALNRSKTALELKDWWSIADAKAFAETAYGLADSLRMDAQSWQKRFDDYYDSKKSDAKNKARAGASYGTLIGAAGGAIFMAVSVSGIGPLATLENIIVAIFAGLLWGAIAGPIVYITIFTYKLLKKTM
jgi:hypothetical protein